MENQIDGVSTPQSPKKPNVILWIVILVIVAVAVGTGVYFWQKMSADKTEKDLSARIAELDKQVGDLKASEEAIVDESSKSDTIDETTETNSFSNDEIGISFDYPKEFGDVSFTSREGEEKPGESGYLFLGTFSLNDKISFGGVSDDFAEGRSGGFLDSTGFVEKNGKYYLRFLNHEVTDSSELNPVKVVNLVGGKALIINQGSLINQVYSEGPTSGPLPGNLGAIINLKGQRFHGLAIWNKDVSNFTLEEFEEMLSTMQIN